MTQAANTKHSDKITGLSWCVSQSAERREPRAQQRRRINRRQGVRDRHEPAGLRDHHFGIAAVMMNAGVFLVTAVDEIAVATKLAIAAGPAEKPDTHALTDHPALNTGAKRIDPPDDFMAWNARPFDWKQSFHCAGIRVADPARFDANPHLARSRSLQRLFRQLQPALADRLDCAISRSDFHQSPQLVGLSIAVLAITKSTESSFPSKDAITTSRPTVVPRLQTPKSTDAGGAAADRFPRCGPGRPCCRRRLFRPGGGRGCHLPASSQLQRQSALVLRGYLAAYGHSGCLAHDG